MKFFTNVTDLNELKKEFKKLCMQHHPDRGGNTATMQAINAEYDQVVKNIVNGKASTDYTDKSFWTSKEEETEIELKVREAITKVIHLSGLIIEIIGVWVWVSGNTKEHKEALKAAGFKWNKARLQWVFMGKKSAGRGNTPMEEIRAKYGSEYVPTQKQNFNQIAYA